MSIDIKGRNVKLWINTIKTKDGREFPSYSIGISKKARDGSYVNMYLKTLFGKDVYIPDGVINGSTMDFEGFLSVDAYTDRNGNDVKNPMVFVTDVQFHGLTETDSFKEAEDDIPF